MLTQYNTSHSDTYHSEISSALDIPAATMVPPMRLPDMETNNPAQKAQPT